MKHNTTLQAFAFAFAAFLATSTGAQAQSLKLPTAVFLSGAASDEISTYYTNTRMGLVEKNPYLSWLQPHPGLMVGVVGASVDVAGALAWNRFVGRHHPKVAAVGLYVASGFRVFLASRNMSRGYRNLAAGKRPWNIGGGVGDP